MGTLDSNEGKADITGPGERPDIPAGPKKKPEPEEDTSGKRAELEATIKKREAEIVQIQKDLPKGDKDDGIPTNEAPLQAAESKVEALLQGDNIRNTLDGLNISKDAAKNAILKLAGGIAKKNGMLEVERAFEQKYTPAIMALVSGLDGIIKKRKIHPHELKSEFNRLTGQNIFAGTEIDATAFITYLSTHSAEKITSDTENIERFYEISGELQNAKAELGTLEGDEKPKDMERWLKDKNMLIKKSFPVKDMAEYPAETIPASIRESDMGGEILRYLEARINELAEENDAVTIKPDGTVEVTKAEKLAEAAAAAQAASQSGETAAEEQNPIMAMLAGFITFIKKLIEGIQKLFGKNPPEDQTGENGNPNPAEPGQEAEGKPQNEPGNKPGNEAESADKNSGQKEELRTALDKRKLTFSEEQLSDTLMAALVQHKDGTKFKADSWENYLGEFLSDDDAAKIRGGSLAERQIIELVTTKPKEES